MKKTSLAPSNEKLNANPKPKRAAISAITKQTAASRKMVKLSSKTRWAW